MQPKCSIRGKVTQPNPILNSRGAVIRIFRVNPSLKPVASISFWMLAGKDENLAEIPF